MSTSPKLVPKDVVLALIQAIRPESRLWLAAIASFAAAFVGFANAGLWSGAWPAATIVLMCGGGFFFSQLSPISTTDSDRSPNAEVVPEREFVSRVDSEASGGSVSLKMALVRPMPEDAQFHLVVVATGRVIHSYDRESAVLGFIRDVVLFGSRQDAAQFRLRVVRSEREEETLSEGESLVRRALEDCAP